MSGLASKKLPVYRLHKPSGQARVRFCGREIYLGRFDSPESRQRYAELLSKIVTGTLPLLDDETGRKAGRTAKAIPSAETAISVNELALGFLRHADQHYRKGGERTDEYDCFVSAIKPMKELYGTLAVSEFGPVAMKAVRQKCVEKGWCRGYVNKSVSRLRHIFRWGVESELVEPATLQKLEAVAPLLAGRTEAPDHPKREAVPLEHIAAVKRKVSKRCRDLIDLQLATGARPGELLMLTGNMLDRSGAIWTAELRDHKTKHFGKVRKLVFGPKAQLILRRHLKADADARLFPIRRESYGHAVVKACESLKIRRWTPHWLRHNVATRVRDEFGIEAAQALAGHSSPSMTAHYASKMDGLAAKIG